MKKKQVKAKPEPVVATWQPAAEAVSDSKSTIHKLMANFTWETPKLPLLEQLDAIRAQAEILLNEEGIKTLDGGILLAVGINSSGKRGVYPVILKETTVGIAMRAIRALDERIDNAGLCKVLEAQDRTMGTWVANYAK